MMSARTTTGYLEFPEGDRLRTYSEPVQIVEAHAIGEIRPALSRIDSLVAEGYHAAGYVAYEAAPAFDPAFHTYPLHDQPLLWFGIYETFCENRSAAPGPPSLPDAPVWKPGMDRQHYDRALQRIREHIAAGDTYQVNYTFPTSAEFHLDGLAWFRDRQRATRSTHSAYLNTGYGEILSLSPELFFSLDGDALTSRPMKGTRPRGLSPEADLELADQLRHSPKEQAENLMIVDMLRNDMGRVCTNNSIRVPALFSIEQYPTVWQMTSTITGETGAGIPEIFRALFPCASVTGAPKIETMKIIRQLETGPRGPYCGAIGWWSPNRKAQFNVAIRTAVLDTQTATARFSVGSGITWDSRNAEEFEECDAKTAVLHHSTPPFELLASLRLESGAYALLPHHLDRLERSASFFAIPFNREDLAARLMAYRSEVPESPAKVRACINKSGGISLSHAMLPEPAPWKVGLSAAPIDVKQPWVYHKTTCRACYDAARATRPDCDDVILFNEEGWLTEATYANIVLEIDGEKLTPPIESGLLGGVYRRHLLEEGCIRERMLTVDDLERADKIHLVNSVRGWIAVDWVPAPGRVPLVQNAR